MTAYELHCSVCNIDLGSSIELPDDATADQIASAMAGYLCLTHAVQVPPPDWTTFGRLIYALPTFAKLMTTTATNAFAILADQVATFNNESILLAMFTACRAGLSGDNVLVQSDIDAINALLVSCNFTITVSL